MKTITIEGQLRTGFGKSSHPPTPLSGNGAWCNLWRLTGDQFLCSCCRLLKTLVYTPSFQIAEVKVDGKTYRCYPERPAV